MSNKILEKYVSIIEAKSRMPKMYANKALGLEGVKGYNAHYRSKSGKEYGLYIKPIPQSTGSLYWTWAFDYDDRQGRGRPGQRGFFDSKNEALKAAIEYIDKVDVKTFTDKMEKDPEIMGVLKRLGKR